MTINEAWFSDAFNAFKQPIPVSYMTFSKPGVMHDSHGDISYGSGDKFISGVGKKETRDSAHFASVYNDNGNKKATPKATPRRAKLANESGVINTANGQMTYTSGLDYIVRHKANDYEVISKDIFELTYTPV
jgi:hypothetical protein